MQVAGSPFRGLGSRSTFFVCVMVGLVRSLYRLLGCKGYWLLSLLTPKVDCNGTLMRLARVALSVVVFIFVVPVRVQSVSRLASLQQLSFVTFFYQSCLCSTRRWFFFSGFSDCGIETVNPSPTTDRYSCLER